MTEEVEESCSTVGKGQNQQVAEKAADEEGLADKTVEKMMVPQGGSLMMAVEVEVVAAEGTVVVEGVIDMVVDAVVATAELEKELGKEAGFEVAGPGLDQAVGNKALVGERTGLEAEAGVKAVVGGSAGAGLEEQQKLVPEEKKQQEAVECGVGVLEQAVEQLDQCEQRFAFQVVGLPWRSEILRVEAALQLFLVCLSTTAHHFAPLIGYFRAVSFSRQCCQHYSQRKLSDHQPDSRGCGFWFQAVLDVH